jgi:hypothetical protein
MMCVFM